MMTLKNNPIPKISATHWQKEGRNGTFYNNLSDSTLAMAQKGSAVLDIELASLKCDTHLRLFIYYHNDTHTHTHAH